MSSKNTFSIIVFPFFLEKSKVYKENGLRYIENLNHVLTYITEQLFLLQKSLSLSDSDKTGVLFTAIIFQYFVKLLETEMFFLFLFIFYKSHV